MRRARTPARQPHPDPARELELQRILDLRASIARFATLIAQYRDEISKLYYQARADSNTQRVEQYLAATGTLHERITDAEGAIARTGEEIAALQEKIPADDLAFLGPLP
jgi:predicted  nucleic acid-binding Zn-ribbon protein